MNKLKFAKRIIAILFMLLLFVLVKDVKANSINSIDMNVEIDQNGSAEVTEVWKINLTQGTEGYRNYSNLEDKKISNFSVADDTGKEYEILSSWDSNKTLNDKAYKCGILNKADGLELCWGISQYGNRTYTLKYTIENLVTQYSDFQGIYINFLNIDQNVGSANIEISSDEAFSIDNSKIWVFGNNGSINFSNGKIAFSAPNGVSSNQYVTILIKCENNKFSTFSNSSKTFEEIYQEALAGTDTQPDIPIYTEKNTNGERDFIIVSLIFFIVFSIFTLTLQKLLYRLFHSANRKNYVEKFEKKLPDIEQIEYYRDIPCNGEITVASWIIDKYKILDKKDLRRGIICAYILKWIEEGKIETKKQKTMFGEKFVLDFSKTTRIEYNELENELFRFMKSAAGENNLLEANEFKKASKMSYDIISNWFDSVINEGGRQIRQNHMITSEANKNGRKVKFIINKDVTNEAVKLIGLEKFLLDYSLISSRESVEVGLWSKYMIFAGLLGIADVVSSQLKELYPETSYKDPILYVMADVEACSMFYDIAGTMVSRANAGEKRERMSSPLYSSGDNYTRNSGGGGQSYHGGGTSAGGSSGGGFR